MLSVAILEPGPVFVVWFNGVRREQGSASHPFHREAGIPNHPRVRLHT